MSALLPSDDAVSLQTTEAMRKRLEELSRVDGKDDYDRVVLMLLDDFDTLLAAWNRRTAPVEGAFQQRVQPWMIACFGEEISRDIAERNHRFLEEALELVQSKGCTAGEAHQLVDYVFARPVGEPEQEAGGVMVTLAALCLAAGLDMREAGETELARIWTKVEKIRAKQAAKPKHSPLPQHVEAPTVPSREDVARVAEFLKMRDEAFIETDEQTDDERAQSAAAILDLLNQPRCQS